MKIKELELLRKILNDDVDIIDYEDENVICINYGHKITSLKERF